MSDLGSLRKSRLFYIYAKMAETDRQIRRDLQRSRGPALDAWLSTRTQEFGRPAPRFGETRPVGMKSRHRNARRRSAARREWSA